MTITFYSNYLNHLQTALCDEFYKYYGNDFTFVSTEKLPDDRLSSGYEDCSHYLYNLNSFENEQNYKLALQLGIDSDIVIIGSAPDTFIKERLNKNKYTFRYYERILKKGIWQILDPRYLYSLIRFHTIYRNKNMYMLCASAFTANDLNLVFAYPNKKFKWGYFTQVNSIDIDKIIAQKPKGKIEIIWTARFIDWKHPELVVKLAFELKMRNYNFHINMIGAGELLNSTQNLIDQLNLTDCVSLLGSMSNTEVRYYMFKSNIFIFTSDQNEGWGVVLNEAMSCGCAVIAGNMIGSVPFLIENGVDGLTFKSKNLKSLLFQTEKLMNDCTLMSILSKNAYEKIKNNWSPKIAATNFISLTNSIINKNEILIEDGPCSIAKNTKLRYK